MKHIPELDSLRGIAAVLIIVYHYTYPSDFYDRYAYCFGPLAMELFFCLSGYLITSIIFKNGGHKGFLVSFYMRRGLRIWPAYYLIVFSYMALLIVKPGNGNFLAWPYFVTYTQTVPAIWGGDVVIMCWPLMPTWSLSVEEQFYIFWPACLLALGMGKRWRVAGFMLFVIAGSTAIRAAGGSEQTLPGRSDGFALGGLLAMTGRFPELNKGFRAALLISALSLALLIHAWATVFGQHRFFDDIMIHLWGVEIPFRMTQAMAFAVVGLTVEFTSSPWLAPLQTRALAYLGKISYGLYLYHLSGVILAEGILRYIAPSLPVLVSRMLAASLTLIMAIFSYYYLEMWFLRMKSAFKYNSVKESTEAIETADRASAE